MKSPVKVKKICLAYFSGRKYNFLCEIEAKKHIEKERKNLVNIYRNVL